MVALALPEPGPMSLFVGIYNDTAVRRPIRSPVDMVPGRRLSVNASIGVVGLYNCVSVVFQCIEGECQMTPDGIPGLSTEPDALPDWDRILGILAQRRSCRDFDGTPIDDATLSAIVRDGTQAPSSCNQQNWHFIIVSDRDLLMRAHDIAGGNHHFAHCSALIYLLSKGLDPATTPSSSRSRGPATT